MNNSTRREFIKKTTLTENITLHNGQLSFSAYRYPAENLAAPTVLCLHGFPDNANSFRHQIDDLVAAGYHVVVPTMRGYEPSSIPDDKNFSIAVMAGDVVAWLDQLETAKVHLVGHDWGTSVAYAVASFAPQRFLSLTTIAVPHPIRFQEAAKKVPSQLLKSWYMVFNQIPWVSDYVSKRNNWAFIAYLWRKWSPNLKVSDAQWADLVSTFEQPGVLQAMLSYYRQNIPISQLFGLKKAPDTQEKTILVPNLVITGADDGCIDTRMFDHAIVEQDFPKGVRLERIPDAGHFTHQEKPGIVNKLMIDWFKANDAKDSVDFFNDE